KASRQGLVCLAEMARAPASSSAQLLPAFGHDSRPPSWRAPKPLALSRPVAGQKRRGTVSAPNVAGAPYANSPASALRSSGRRNGPRGAERLGPRPRLLLAKGLSPHPGHRNAARDAGRDMCFTTAYSRPRTRLIAAAARI